MPNKHSKPNPPNSGRPALGAVRLSRLKDDTSSPERQRADLHRYPGVEYVHIVEDLDVSATKFSPFERPELGPWLTEPEKLAQYDIFVCWKADRLCRKAADMRSMLTWADEHGKIIVFQQDNLVYDPNASGFGKALNDAMISLVAAFAEMEALNTATRVRSAHAYLRENKSWGGGHLPLGYTVKKIPIEGEPGQFRKVLVPHPESKKVFDEIADRLIAGESRYAIAADFAQRKILSPADWSRKLQGNPVRNTPWNGAAIDKLFRADTGLGYQMHYDPETGDRVPRRDEAGNPIQAWEPLISKEKLRQVRKALDARKIAKRPHIENQANPLLDVAVCFDCGRNLGRHEKKSTGQVYLRCPGTATNKNRCDARGVFRIELAWSLLDEYFLHYRGQGFVSEVRYVKNSDYDAQLDELREEYAAVAAQLAKARSSAARELLQPRLDELDTRMGELEEQRASASGRLATETLNETYADRWRASDEAGRREMMIKAGIKLRIKRAPRTNMYRVEIVDPNPNPPATSGDWDDDIPKPGPRTIWAN